MLEMERQWRHVAKSYEFIEGLERFLLDRQKNALPQGRTRRETDCTTGPRTESGNQGNAARTEVLRQTQWRGLRVELRAGAELVRTPATEPGFRCLHARIRDGAGARKEGIRPAPGLSR